VFRASLLIPVLPLLLVLLLVPPLLLLPLLLLLLLLLRPLVPLPACPESGLCCFGCVSCHSDHTVMAVAGPSLQGGTCKGGAYVSAAGTSLKLAVECNLVNVSWGNHWCASTC